MSTKPRYNLVDDDRRVLAGADTYDKACAMARKLSGSGERIEVRLNDRSGRVLAGYKGGRETFYTYSGGREFGYG